MKAVAGLAEGYGAHLNDQLVQSIGVIELAHQLAATNQPDVLSVRSIAHFSMDRPNIARDEVEIGALDRRKHARREHPGRPYTLYLIPFITQLYKIEYFIVVMVIVNPILVYCLKILFEDHSVKNLKKISNLLKSSMVFGLIAIYFGV